MSNFFTYYVQFASGEIGLAVESSSGKLFATSIDNSDYSQQFILSPDGNNNHSFFSISAQKFLTSNGSGGFITATSTTPHPFEIINLGKGYTISDLNFSLVWQLTGENPSYVIGGNFHTAGAFLIPALSQSIDSTIG
jgi:hypothetical protein